MKKEIKNLYLITGFFIILAASQFSCGKSDTLKLNPPLNKIYKYSLVKTLESYNKYERPYSPDNFSANNRIDTFRLNFTLENIASPDSLITFKLTFFDFFKTKKPFKIIFRNTGSLQQTTFKDPYALSDSIGSFIRGKSIKVITNHKGVVKAITGMDDLVKSVSGMSNKSEGEITRTISDYISTNALKDLLNRFLSTVPGFTIKEADKWVRNITLITKAPVKLSNLYALEQYNSDTAYVSVQSIISAEQSEGGTVYMKGKGKGIAIINYITGMPYLFETRSETETTTTEKQYEYVIKEHFLVREYH